VTKLFVRKLFAVNHASAAGKFFEINFVRNGEIKLARKNNCDSCPLLMTLCSSFPEKVLAKKNSFSFCCCVRSGCSFENLKSDQCDQIGRIFAYLEIVFFRQLFENYRKSPITYMRFFSTEKKVYFFRKKIILATFAYFPIVFFVHFMKITVLERFFHKI
jgi:hypothetical protein